MTYVNIYGNTLIEENVFWAIFIISMIAIFATGGYLVISYNIDTVADWKASIENVSCPTLTEIYSYAEKEWKREYALNKFIEDSC